MKKKKSGGLKGYWAKKFDSKRAQGFWIGAPFWLILGIIIATIWIPK